jgi:hypothetical protein
MEIEALLEFITKYTLNQCCGSGMFLSRIPILTFLSRIRGMKRHRILLYIKIGMKKTPYSFLAFYTVVSGASFIKKLKKDS